MARKFMNKFWIWLNHLGSPPNFWTWSQPWLRGCLALAFVTLAIGLYGGLVLAPADYLQGESFRIIYIHVQVLYAYYFVPCRYGKINNVPQTAGKSHPGIYFSFSLILRYKKLIAYKTRYCYQ